ncbi:MAG: hydrolase [Legionellales bacterium]|nr:hydrolase [Legionellales bacterium]
MSTIKHDTLTFKPAWWLRNPHLQTLFPVICKRHIKNLKLARERLELPDADFIDLDYTQDDDRPIVLILHGLEGSISSHYAKGMLQAIHRNGWRGVFMHFRGCSGEHNRLPIAYHSGETEDLAYVVNLLHQRFPLQPIAAIGFSLGANMLLKWLGETGQHNILCASVAVSTPFELEKCVTKISTGFSRIYQQHLLSALRRKMQDKFELTPSSIPLPDFRQLHSLYDFDNYVTAPLHGFADAKEYYTQSSSRQFLRAIDVPTLLLQAKDDPFVPFDALPLATELSGKIQLELVEKGGHVGFISGNFPGRPHYWLEERIPEFLKNFL